MVTITNMDVLDQWSFVQRDVVYHSWGSNEYLPVTLQEKIELKRLILKGIDEANECLKICSFILTDVDVINALVRKLDSTETAIFILTQLDESKFSTSFLTDEEIKENPSQYHLDAIATLNDKGAHIRASGSVHAKFIIVDNDYTILTSANITRSSLNENPESGVILRDDLCKDAAIVFDLVYRYGTTYSRFIKAGGNKRYILQNENNLQDSWLPDASNGFLFTLSGSKRYIYDEMIRIIDEANSELILSTYCIVGVEKLKEFTDAIKNAIDRGVRVVVFCRGMNYRSDHLYGSKLLADLGCELYGDLLNHSKGLSNENDSMIFTANVDGRHGLEGGFEVGAKLSLNQHNAIRSFMLWQVENAPYKFLKNVAREEVFRTYEWYCKTRGKRSPERIKSLTIHGNGLSKKTQQDLKNKAFYGVYKGEELVALDIEGEFLSAKKIGETLEVEHTNYKYYNNEKYLIRYDELRLDYE